MARLLKLGIYDPFYLDAFYQNRPGLVEARYDSHHKALIGDRAASSDFWTAALGRIGYETADIIANAGPLQRSWAREHRPTLPPANDLFDIASAQIKAFLPEILLVADYSTFSPTFLRELRAECPSVRLVVGWCGAPFRDLAVMREWDLALSCIPEHVALFRADGLEAHHVDHGFDPRVLDQLGPPAANPSPFSFLGSVVKRPGFHEAREILLVSLLGTTPLEIWSSAAGLTPPIGYTDRLKNAARLVLGKRSAEPVHPLIAERARPPLFGLAMFQKLRDSAVTLNTHIDVSSRSASNMRLFEACGVGACLLTDRKDNLAALFEPDSEVVTYAGAEEAIEKYCYLADHPAERAAIAAAGQRRALKDHNFDRRAERIDEILRASLRAA